jgi:hypothetical protein
MRLFSYLFFLCILFSCKKNNGSQGGTYQPPVQNPSPQHSDTSHIYVTINDKLMTVTLLQYNRSSSTVYFAASNSLQKVQVYCFRFYGSSGFNYQFSDSITYSTRTDTLSTWYTRTAGNKGDVYYNCCSLPTKDSPIDGNFTAPFNDEGDIFIKGNFHLKF